MRGAKPVHPTGGNQIGIREVKSQIMERVVKDHVNQLVTERLPQYPRRGSLRRAGRLVAESLRPKRTDTADDKRYKEIVVRSLAGFGSAIPEDVLTINDGNARLVNLQKMIQDAIPEPLL